MNKIFSLVVVLDSSIGYNIEWMAHQNQTGYFNDANEV